MPGAGFSKKLRLCSAAEFKAVFGKADYKVSSRCLLVLANRNAFPFPRLGLVISKKNISLAVERNRIKRVLRAAFRANQGLLEGLDIVILARSGLGDMENLALHQSITRLWQELSVKRGNRETRQTADPAVPLT